MDQYAETIVDVVKIESDFERFSPDQNIQKLRGDGLAIERYQ